MNPKNIFVPIISLAVLFTISSQALCITHAAGLSDNTLMHDLLNISRIQEIVGGSRQIQLYIIANALSSIFKTL